MLACAVEAAGKAWVVGVDVGKQVFVGCLKGEQGQVYRTIKWRSPGETRLFVELLKGLVNCPLEVAMEPSGSYGDPLRHLLWAKGIPVYRVSAKRSHDATEVYDGVPSSHDAKSAAIIAKLHQDGASELWPLREQGQRDLRALVKRMDLFHKQFHDSLNHLEGHMARYWPELGEYLDFTRVTFLSLIQEFAGPEQVAAQGDRAAQFMRSVGGRFLQSKKIQEVIGSSRETTGVHMTPEEAESLRLLAEHTLYLYRALQKAKRKMETVGQEQASVQAMSPTLGKATAAVLVAEGGDPRQYDSARQWVKTFGLNLKERSSGKHMGRRRITKRGSGRARKWLFLAALRLARLDPVVRAWYQRKVSRDGNIKMKAVVAVMRKYVKALWHVAKGNPFDSTRLFDTKRLGIGAT